MPLLKSQNPEFKSDLLALEVCRPKVACPCCGSVEAVTFHNPRRQLMRCSSCGQTLFLMQYSGGWKATPLNKTAQEK
jgi:ribosomal protein S27E